MREEIQAVVQIQGGWLHFHDPVRVIEARTPDRVVSVLEEVDRWTRDRRAYAVGFVSYEAGAAFNLAVCEGAGPAWPLVWFALFDPATVRPSPELPWTREPYEVGPLRPSNDRPAFKAVFRRIKEHLAAGDTYQVNYTFRMEGAFTGHAPSLFRDLVAAQGGRHSAFIDTGTHAICSASPELFFSKVGTDVSARPMKGTEARGRTLAEDAEARDRLRSSRKQQAENVMIVDMVRNDLGRIAEVGSVAVPELFAVERYPNVWQMTSLVTARSSAPLQSLFAALHPSASVTGAPKIRTMQILRELEERPRGIYTGAIGYVTPAGDAHFNVAIRTALVDHRSGAFEFGIGSGIVWDSEADSEYDECLLKSSVLASRLPPDCFELLETMRWTSGEGFLLLERHLMRMRDSADYFGYAFDERVVRAGLTDLAAAARDSGVQHPLRVRLLVSRSGTVRLEQFAVTPSPVPLRVRIAARPVDEADPFLFHKTTNRGMYATAAEGRGDGVDDVILWNARGQVTEATTANIVVDRHGSLVTPPVACGLLGGTFRAELMDRGMVREAVVTLDELRAASRLWLINSVYEWREAQL